MRKDEAVDDLYDDVITGRSCMMKLEEEEDDLGVEG